MVINIPRINSHISRRIVRLRMLKRFVHQPFSYPVALHFCVCLFPIFRQIGACVPVGLLFAEDVHVYEFLDFWFDSPSVGLGVVLVCEEADVAGELGVGVVDASNFLAGGKPSSFEPVGSENVIVAPHFGRC